MTNESYNLYIGLTLALRDEVLALERLARKAEREGAPFRARLAWNRSKELDQKLVRIIDAWKE